MIDPIHYPRTERDPAEAFGPRTLALVTAQILSWQQAAGAVGALHLHECWNDNSVLSRGYHGPTAANLGLLLSSALKLGKGAGEAWVAHFADSLAGQLLWQQAPEGGFFHASGEYEPTFTAEESCPIHQMLPALGLLEYYEAQPANAAVREVIETKLEKHFEWFQRWWKRGNAWSGPLKFAGWCGVTNQDLVAIAAMAHYGKAVGDWRPFEEFGRPALDTYLGPRYLHERTGLFERGDRANFSERSHYMIIIRDMLERVQAIRPDPRVPDVVQHISEVLQSAAFRDDRGVFGFAWGADDAATQREGSLQWDRSRTALSPGFIHCLELYPETVRSVEETLASRVFADGMLAGPANKTSPLFAVAPSASITEEFWGFLIKRNPGVKMSTLPKVPAVRRSFLNVEYSSFADGWVIRTDGEVNFRGVKQLSFGVLKGEADFSFLALREPEPEFVEVVDAES